MIFVFMNIVMCLLHIKRSVSLEIVCYGSPNSENILTLILISFLGQILQNNNINHVNELILKRVICIH